MMSPATQTQIAAYLLTMTRQALEQLAREKDVPLYTLKT
jgi:hypothetical protein